jgi:hypothetical protein
MAVSNTLGVMPRNAHAPVLDERVARQAICLHIGLGPQRTLPGYDTAEEAAEALVALQDEIPEPTLVIAPESEVTAAWVFEAHVPSAQFAPWRWAGRRWRMACAAMGAAHWRRGWRRPATW